MNNSLRIRSITATQELLTNTVLSTRESSTARSDIEFHAGSSADTKKRECVKGVFYTLLITNIPILEEVGGLNASGGGGGISEACDDALDAAEA